MEQHIDQVRKVFKKSGCNDKDIYRLASVLSRLEAEVGTSKCWNVGDVQVLDKASQEPGKLFLMKFIGK